MAEDTEVKFYKPATGQLTTTSLNRRPLEQKLNLPKSSFL